MGRVGALKMLSEPNATTFKVGIIGMGKMGILHATILNALPGCSVVAICEKEPMLRILGKKVFSNVKFYGDLESMIKQEELSGVYITTPIVTHRHLVETLADVTEKIGVFVEKPLATNYEEALRMCNVVERANMVNVVGFQKRFSEPFLKAKGIIDELLGEPLVFKAYSFVSGVFKEGGGWRFKAGGGGTLLDLGAHLLDLLTWYFGEPEWLSSFESSFYSNQVEDYVHAVLGYNSGLKGYIDVSWSVEGYRLPETKIEVRGTRGSLTVSEDYIRFIDSTFTKKQEFKKPALYRGVDLLVGDPEYCLEDRSFVQCTREGRGSDLDFKVAATINKLIDLIHESAKSKRVVQNDNNRH